jgi:hypothetical protein
LEGERREAEEEGRPEDRAVEDPVRNRRRMAMETLILNKG